MRAAEPNAIIGKGEQYGAVTGIAQANFRMKIDLLFRGDIKIAATTPRRAFLGRGPVNF